MGISEDRPRPQEHLRQSVLEEEDLRADVEAGRQRGRQRLDEGPPDAAIVGVELVETAVLVVGRDERLPFGVHQHDGRPVRHRHDRANTLPLRRRRQLSDQPRLDTMHVELARERRKPRNRNGGRRTLDGPDRGPGCVLDEDELGVGLADIDDGDERGHGQSRWKTGCKDTTTGDASGFVFMMSPMKAHQRCITA